MVDGDPLMGVRGFTLEMNKHYYPTGIPKEVVEKSLLEIEEWFEDAKQCTTNEERGRYLHGRAFGMICELKNILVTCTKVE